MYLSACRTGEDVSDAVNFHALSLQLLRQSEGCLELLDVSAEIPGLKFRPGLKSWKVRFISII